MSMKEQIVDELFGLKLTFIVHAVMIIVALIAAFYFFCKPVTPDTSYVISGLIGFIPIFIGMGMEDVGKMIDNRENELSEIYQKITDD